MALSLEVLEYHHRNFTGAGFVPFGTSTTVSPGRVAKLRDLA